ncbi:MAG: hypothetical protein U1E14_19000 [Geminicoccaceae bacterium]
MGTPQTYGSRIEDGPIAAAAGAGAYAAMISGLIDDSEPAPSLMMTPRATMILRQVEYVSTSFTSFLT